MSGVIYVLIALVVGFVGGFAMGAFGSTAMTGILVAKWIGRGWIRFNHKGFVITQVDGVFDSDEALQAFVKARPRGRKQ